MLFSTVIINHHYHKYLCTQTLMGFCGPSRLAVPPSFRPHSPTFIALLSHRVPTKGITGNKKGTLNLSAHVNTTANFLWKVIVAHVGSCAAHFYRTACLLHAAFVHSTVRHPLRQSLLEEISFHQSTGITDTQINVLFAEKKLFVPDFGKLLYLHVLICVSMRHCSHIRCSE